MLFTMAAAPSEFAADMDGDIAAPPAATSTSLTTLDEPVSATLVRAGVFNH